MRLYICKNTKHKGQEGEELLQKVLSDYSGDERIRGQLKRTELGKPYFENSKVHFSISHTADIWMCLMAEFNVGADIQKERTVNCEGIARRFFSEKEAVYVCQHGKADFFRLWTMKEAYVKYTGRGFAKEGFAEPSLVEADRLAECICREERTVYFRDLSEELKMQDIDFGGKIYASVCAEKREEIFYRFI